MQTSQNLINNERCGTESGIDHISFLLCADDTVLPAESCEHL